MQISSIISDSYIINLRLGYQLCLICPLIPLYFSKHLHRNPGIFSPYVWTLPSKSYLPFCLKQVYSFLCGQGGDVTLTYSHIATVHLYLTLTYSINLSLGYQLLIIFPLIPLYFTLFFHRNSSIRYLTSWTLPSESFLPFCLVQEYSNLWGQGRDVTVVAAVGYLSHYGKI